MQLILRPYARYVQSVLERDLGRAISFMWCLGMVRRFWEEAKARAANYDTLKNVLVTMIRPYL